MLEIYLLRAKEHIKTAFATQVQLWAFASDDEEYLNEETAKIGSGKEN